MHKQLRFFYTLVSILLMLTQTEAQNAGETVFQFLANPTSAHAAASGGAVAAHQQPTLDLVWQNPALLRNSHHHQLNLNYGNYFSDISSAAFAFAHNTQFGSFALQFQHFGYGEFIAADEFGNQTGNFTANDNAIALSWSHPLLDSLLHLGVSLHSIFSNYEQYTSTGLAVSMGLTYDSPNKLFSAGLVLKHVGAQITHYATEQGQLPYTLNIGLSNRLAHAPFRINFAFKNLLANQDFANYLGGGIEFIPTKNFYIGLGYNHQRRTEMKLDTGTGMAGFTWGFGLRIKSFAINFANESYHKAGSTQFLSVTSDLSRLF